jgi:hypothetical protein
MEPQRRISDSQDGGSTTLDLLLGQIRVLKDVLLREQSLLMGSDPGDLEAVVTQKIVETEKFQALMIDAGFTPEGEVPSWTTSESDRERSEFMKTFRAEIIHLAEIASVNMVVAQESAQAVSAFMKVLRQEEGAFDTYGSRGDLGTPPPAPAMVSTRG